MLGDGHIGFVGWWCWMVILVSDVSLVMLNCSVRWAMLDADVE